MAKEIHQLEQAAVTLHTAGGTTANNVQQAASTVLNCTAGGNAAEMFFADFELNTGFGSAPAVGAVINLYLIPSIDGTNYADYDATNHNMPPACFVGAFIVNKAATASQRMPITNVPLRPLKYTVVVDNQSAQTMSTAWVLTAVASQDQYNA